MGSPVCEFHGYFTGIFTVHAVKNVFYSPFFTVIADLHTG